MFLELLRRDGDKVTPVAVNLDLVMFVDRETVHGTKAELQFRLHFPNGANFAVTDFPDTLNRLCPGRYIRSAT